MSIKFTGQCLCGTVSYQGEVEQATVAQCHCKNCQRHSGSAFSVNLIVPMKGLNIDKAQLAQFKDSAESGDSVYRYSCNACHSVVLSGNEDLTGLGFLKVGTLDDTSFINPTLSVWECSAQHWVAPLANAAHFDKNPPM